ncbi:ABC transporter permease [Chitinophaga sp. XS-30]|uniref:ABC transporter permease n=1 Tax=Chitinophaga sp. XS-30 TaxID=2604421 RepID=UPI0011DC8E45|nr:ABC transporter permease [Chitinophaga sp. XS-30]QEH41852.1 FtsX-like permease family protein [Chitinophaga sp. XS-30]
MLKHYLKTALRHLYQQKLLSIINIGGLALGMAGAILLILGIRHELSFEKFHEKKERIYKVYGSGIVDGRLQSSSTMPAPLAPVLEKDYPGIKGMTRIVGTGKLLGYGDQKLSAYGNYADPYFLQMFTFPLLKGNAGTALDDRQSIVITESLGRKIFGKGDPFGKTIQLDNKEHVTVTGILKDLPGNTEFKFDYLLPWSQSGIGYHWDHINTAIFVELQPSVDIDVMNANIKDVMGRYDEGNKTTLFLHRLDKLHLYGQFENGKVAGGNISNLRFLGILAGIMLLIGCINYINLGTARSEKRAREVGVRKVAGAPKKVLVFQFIGESVLLAFFAGLLALVFVQLALPMFSAIVKADLGIAYRSASFWLGLAGFIILTGVLAGSYPAFYLSSFKPSAVMKGPLKGGKGQVTPRKILVVVQFMFAIFLINFTIIFKQQINFGMSREPGFVKENLVFHYLTDDLRKNYTVVKDELIRSGLALSVCQSSTTVTKSTAGLGGLKWEGMNNEANTSFGLITTSGDFVETNGLTLIAGRDLDVDRYPADTRACLINEAAAKAIGFKDPVGRIMLDDSVQWKIIGVVKDFLIGAPIGNVQPLIIRGDTWADVMSIRLSSAQNVAAMEAILKKYNPRFPTSFHFADEEHAAKFRQPRNVAKMITTLATVAIFISCMGLFALASYTAENRRKEIGIRKVLGASATRITSLLVTDFLKLVIIAIIIISPVAWWFMNFFLQKFYYRTPLSLWIPVIAGTSALLIALFTVSSQSIKAALADPVKSLRSE